MGVRREAEEEEDGSHRGKGRNRERERAEHTEETDGIKRTLKRSRDD
jgi:hypothetical protein